MARPTVLVSWIGHADLQAMAADLNETERRKVLAGVQLSGKHGEAPGPIKTMLANMPVDEVHLLSNYSQAASHAYAGWLGGGARLHQVKLPDPTDYSRVFEAADAALNKITSHKQRGAPSTAEANRRPSGLKATLEPEWPPLRMKIALPLLGSQILTA
jgi:hypothetical protein